MQRRLNVFDVGPTLYRCYANVLCLLGILCKKSWEYLVSQGGQRLVEASLRPVLRCIQLSTECWFNVGRLSAMLAQHQNSIEDTVSLLGHSVCVGGNLPSLSPPNLILLQVTTGAFQGQLTPIHKTTGGRRQ